MPIQTGTKAEADELERQFSRKSIDAALHTIAAWPDYKFTSGDGRTFAFFEDGSSILHRIQAVHVRSYLSPVEEQWIAGQRGAIVQVTDTDPLSDNDLPEAMWYQDVQQLCDSWIELHEICHVDMTEAEQEWFDIYRGVYGRDDESDEIDDDK